MNQGADAAILAGGHEIEIFNFCFRNKYGIRIKFIEDGIYPGLDQLAMIQFINIVVVELFIHGCENVKIL